jgi:hypothetical protein
MTPLSPRTDLATSRSEPAHQERPSPATVALTISVGTIENRDYESSVVDANELKPKIQICVPVNLNP